MARARASTLWRTQNFLRDPRLAEHLVRRSGISSGDVVYDLGAGTGVLTAALAQRATRVVGLEADPALVERLRIRFKDQTNVVVRQADIRSYPLPRAEHVVFASPPFDITADLVRKLTTAPVPPRDAYLVLQREAAERYTGSPRQTLAALQIAPWFSIDVLHRFHRTDFAPAPAVDIVLVQIHKRGPPLVRAAAARSYRDLIAATFTTWRPSVGESLSFVIGPRPAARLLLAAGIDPGSRPSAIPFTAWLTLYERFGALPDGLRSRVRGADARLRREQRRVTTLHRTRAPRDELPSTSRRYRVTTDSSGASCARVNAVAQLLQQNVLAPRSTTLLRSVMSVAQWAQNTSDITYLSETVPAATMPKVDSSRRLADPLLEQGFELRVRSAEVAAPGRRVLLSREALGPRP